MKASIDDVIKMGFDAIQFGSDAAFELDAATGYVYDILYEYALEAENEVGATVYAAASDTGTAKQKLDHARLRKAEMYLSAAELFRRRAAQLDKDGRATGTGDRPVDLLKQYRNQADDFELRAWAAIERVSGKPRHASIAGAVVETGPYEAVL